MRLLRVDLHAIRTPDIVATLSPDASIDFVSRTAPVARPDARMAREALTAAFI